ncbi:hypothetical protein HDU76_009195, partial [Blyttiomyces sp. JEL0837]
MAAASKRNDDRISATAESPHAVIGNFAGSSTGASGIPTSNSPPSGYIPDLPTGPVGVSMKPAGGMQETLKGRSDQELLGFLSPKFLSNPKCMNAFLRSLQVERSAENLYFWHKATQIRALQATLRKEIADTYRRYFAQTGAGGSSTAVCSVLPPDDEAAMEVHAHIFELLEMLSAPGVFEEARRVVYEKMFRGSFLKFVQLHMAFTAKNALIRQTEHTLAGLGECFCLTDPQFPDNPIVLATDGFVSVTVWVKVQHQVIPEDCRFLQGPLTDRAAVKRIGRAIAAGEETTELFLNYKYDGTPFWNLVFIAPLRKVDGTIRYFIGGQIDVTAKLQSSENLIQLLGGVGSVPPARPGEDGLDALAPLYYSPDVPGSDAASKSSKPGGPVHFGPENSSVGGGDLSPASNGGFDRVGPGSGTSGVHASPKGRCKGVKEIFRSLFGGRNRRGQEVNGRGNGNMGRGAGVEGVGVGKDVVDKSNVEEGIEQKIFQKQSINMRRQ